MFDQSAIQQLAQTEASKALNEAVKAALAGKGVVVVHQDFKTHDLESYLPERRRARNLFSTGYVADFVKYVTKHQEAGCTVYVDADSMSATAVLNQGSPEHPGHCDNKAKVKLQKLALYNDILTLCAGGAISQRLFAQWVEERNKVTTALDTEQKELLLTNVVTGIRSVTIERASSASNSVQALSAERSELESVMAKAKDADSQLPTYLKFNTRPYKELPEREFFVQVNLITSGREPSFSFSLWGAEQHREEMAEQFSALTAEAFVDENAPPVLIGSFSA